MLTDAIEANTQFDSLFLSEPKIDWFMKDIQSSPFTFLLRKSIINGSALAVSDGYYFPLTKTGACAWIVFTPDGRQWIQGGDDVPGEAYEQNRYRSELCGELGVSIIMDSIQLPIMEPHSKYHITVICDGLSA